MGNILRCCLGNRIYWLFIVLANSAHSADHVLFKTYVARACCVSDYFNRQVTLVIVIALLSLTIQAQVLGVTKNMPWRVCIHVCAAQIQKSSLLLCSCRQYYFIESLQTGDGGVYRCGAQTSCGRAFSTNDVVINSMCHPAHTTPLRGH